MKSFLLALLLAVCPEALFGANSPHLSGVKAVYLLPMGNGLDQFLANRLANADIFPVVTDPAKADAIFTDKLGEALQERLNELYPPPPKPKPAAKDTKSEGKSDDTQAESKDKIKNDLPRSSFGRGKGTLFLVDTKTRTVIWSAYEKPKNSTPDEMNRVAGKIADRLKKDLEKK
jgi:hypothetical protein